MKLGGLLKSLAPTIASAAGGPMAGMAVKMAAQKLGMPEATANEIEDLIERQPEKASLLREADKEFKDRIREMEIDLESFKTEVEDPFDHKNLNMQVPEFADLIPSAENIAVVIYNKLIKHLDKEKTLEVILYETPKNFVKYCG